MGLLLVLLKWGELSWGEFYVGQLVLGRVACNSFNFSLAVKLSLCMMGKLLVQEMKMDVMKLLNLHHIYCKANC